MVISYHIISYHITSPFIIVPLSKQLMLRLPSMLPSSLPPSLHSLILSTVHVYLLFFYSSSILLYCYWYDACVTLIFNEESLKLLSFPLSHTFFLLLPVFVFHLLALHCTTLHSTPMHVADIFLEP